MKNQTLTSHNTSILLSLALVFFTDMGAKAQGCDEFAQQNEVGRLELIETKSYLYVSWNNEGWEVCTRPSRSTWWIVHCGSRIYSTDTYGKISAVEDKNQISWGTSLRFHSRSIVCIPEGSTYVEDSKEIFTGVVSNSNINISSMHRRKTWFKAIKPLF